jgi:FAD dependent oxidoreductase TIGR03364
MTSATFDLAVVGGGVIGLAHAYAAASRGLRVAVFERDERANGASIRNFGFITVSGQERGDLWRLARRTRDVWATVASQAAIRIEHQGLCLAARSPEAIAVIEAFLKTEMGEGCRLLDAHAFRAASGGLGGPDLIGGLHSPHELRVESRTAIPALAGWLSERLDVRFFYQTAVHEVSPPRLRTSRGVVEAGAVTVCPGDDLTGLYPEAIEAYGLRRCRLSMLKLADPGVRLRAALMSDLGLTRYRGYAALAPAEALEVRLRDELPGAFEHGVHLIAVQGADGGLVVGDSHHYADLPEPFAPAQAEREILDEFARASGLAPPPVLERWTGVYPVADARNYMVHAPEPAVRVVIVTCGAGASIGFGLAERVVGELTGARTEAAA